METTNLMNLDADQCNVMISKNDYVMVDVWAEWCGPCKALSPTLEEFAVNNPDVTVIKLNADENPEFCTENAIRGLPSVLFFKDGEYKERLVGNNSLKRFQEVKDVIFK